MKLREIFETEEDEKREIPKGVFTVIAFVLIALLLNVLAWLCTEKSEFIYFWDNAMYWDMSRKIVNGALRDGFFISIYDSISNFEYNHVAGLLSAGVMKLFGEQRTVYVLSLVNLYLLPMLILVFKFTKRHGKAPFVTLILTVLLCPTMVYMTFLGFVDIGGALGGFLCIYIYLGKDDKRAGIFGHILIGILLVLMIIWRRWYAFFAVSFVTAMMAEGLIGKNKLYKPIITTAVVALVLFFLFRDFMFNILLKNYGELYSGYKFSVNTDLKFIARYFGVIYVLGLMISSVVIIVKKQEFKLLFLWIQIIVCAVMFMMLQTHGQQHLLLYVPSFAAITVIVLKHIKEVWQISAVSGLAVATTIGVCLNRTQPQNIRDIKNYAIIPSFTFAPPKNENVYEILELKKRLDSYIGEEETLGVLASSFVLNDDILQNVELSLGEKMKRKDYIVSLPQVDSRDRDLTKYGSVNYVLVANPPQTHLADGSQRVVTEAVASFNNWTDIAMSYEEVYDFYCNLAGMELKLFKRVRDVSEVAYTHFRNRLK